MASFIMIPVISLFILPVQAHADSNINNDYNSSAVRIDNGHIINDVKINNNNHYDYDKADKNNNRAIFGDDDRKQVSINDVENENWAKRTVLIQYDGWNQDISAYDTGTCTGTLVSLNTVLTAGHCIVGVKEGENGPTNETTGIFSKNYRIMPAAYVDEITGKLVKPYGEFKANESKIYTDSSWVDSANPNQDWGIIKLQNNVPEDIGYYNVLASNREDISDMNIRISGYPTIKINQHGNVGMWTDTGKTLSPQYIDSTNDRLPNWLTKYNSFNMVPYYVDSNAGESGAGVIANPAGEEGIIAINSRESAYDNGTSLDDNMPNMGVRITTSLKSIINSVK